MLPAHLRRVMRVVLGLFVVVVFYVQAQVLACPTVSQNQVQSLDLNDELASPGEEQTAGYLPCGGGGGSPYTQDALENEEAIFSQSAKQIASRWDDEGINVIRTWEYQAEDEFIDILIYPGLESKA